MSIYNDMLDILYTIAHGDVDFQKLAGEAEVRWETRKAQMTEEDVYRILLDIIVYIKREEQNS